MMDQLSPPWRLKAHLLKIYKMHNLIVRPVRSYELYQVELLWA